TQGRCAHQGLAALYLALAIPRDGERSTAGLRSRRRGGLRGPWRMDLRSRRVEGHGHLRLAHRRREATPAAPLLPDEADLRCEPPLGDAAGREESDARAGPPSRRHPCGAGGRPATAPSHPTPAPARGGVRRGPARAGPRPSRAGEQALVAHRIPTRPPTARSQSPKVTPRFTTALWIRRSPARGRAAGLRR